MCFAAEVPCPVLVYVLQGRYQCLGNGAMRTDYRIEKLFQVERWRAICLPDQKNVKLNLNSTTLVLIWSTDWFLFFFNNVCPADKTWSYVFPVPSLDSWSKRNQTRNKSKSCFPGEGLFWFWHWRQQIILTTYQAFCQLFYHWEFWKFSFFPWKLCSSSSRN